MRTSEAKGTQTSLAEIMLEVTCDFNVILLWNIKKEGNARVNMALRRVRGTIVAVVKQLVLSIPIAFLQLSLSGMQSACAILSLVVSPALLDFSTLSHKRHDFRQQVIEHKTCVLIHSTTFVRNIFNSKNN